MRILFVFAYIFASDILKRSEYRTFIVAIDGEYLVIVNSLRLDVVEIKNGDEDESGKTCVEASVIEDEAAVHSGSRCADDGAEYSRNDSILEAVATRNGAKTCCEGKSVDIRLSRECPRHVRSNNKANATNESEEDGISKDDRRYVFWMLTVCGEGERSENNACGRTCKSYALGQEGEYRGKPEDDVEISKDAKSVYTKVDKTERYTELVGVVKTVSRAGCELAIVLEAFAVEEKAEYQSQQEQ